MKIAIITNAGISSRFNEGVPESDKKLKAIFYEKDSKSTLLYHQLLKCSYADKIILVSGYKADSLGEYVKTLEDELKDKITIVFNDHFSDLASGYSLYLGLEEAFKYEPSEILFVEGDLDIDDSSFAQVIASSKSVLTYTYEPIYANKAVVLYKDGDDKYRYAFNSSHGMLTIDSPFSCILNSGQTWKFTEIDKLIPANKKFFDEAKGDTNLKIIQNYLDFGVDIELIPLKRWTNCNTRDDYRKIVSYWENEE
ncbi:DUF6564 domain-containing protein [Butyrivibrio sp. INlla21]|uniref:DUF6564 domain-containing protein n=1 Tax=Butyrivibrio sp. INlla21 TaxID=1520811 RepID=UPI0008E9C7A5|nr:DUF6564 domain-containing protein [Butyrivibrio sp. INlla21]SFU87123.1 hypothetical protein SAMN02910342_02129 [Butyrivibrio sp. INlla21]